MIIDRIFQDGIFIIHALKGYEVHENRIKTIFPKLGMNPEFVTEGDPKNFTEELLDKYFVSDIKNNLSHGVLSCTLNHILTFERIVARELPYAIVFENDPFFLGDFRGKFQDIRPEIEHLKPGFLVSLEISTFKMPAFRDLIKGKKLYRAKTSRMAGAYLIDLVAAKNILNYLQCNKCDTVVDWWFNELIDNEVVRMYWAHPPLVEQGSHNGKMDAGISSKSRSIFRRTSWKLQKFYKFYISRLFRNNYLIE